MAETVLATASQKQKWISRYFKEYIRESKFKPYMGTSPMNIIIVKHDLEEEAGKTINIPLITRLKGRGVTGNQRLEGNEEALGNYNFPISIDWRRHAVEVPKSQSYKTEINLLNAARDMLREWEAEQLRDDIIEAFYSIMASTSGTVPIRYGDITENLTDGGYEILPANYVASEAEKDAYLALNSDRVLFGALRSNNSSNDFSASLANLDTTNDIGKVAIFELAKRMAKAASPHIRPYKTKDGREYFVAMCNPRVFRDVSNDTAMSAVNRDARPRDVEANPIFQDGDLIKNGIIYREVEETPVVTDAGNGSADVAQSLLCGAQTAGIAWGQSPTPRTELDRDYQFRPGVGIEELLGVEKLFYNGKQHGAVSVWTAAAPDT